jgi:hypothetical protein
MPVPGLAALAGVARSSREDVAIILPLVPRTAIVAGMRFSITALCALIMLGPPSAPAADTKRLLTSSGTPAEDTYFPIAVWLQSPRNAAQFQAAGINLYVGLWQGPTEGQLAELKKENMPVICDQNDVGLAHLDDPLIAAWMHGDEPDNAQPLPGGKGYGPPILPEVIVKDYQKIRKADPSRPVLLNLGQGVAYDNYIGRGVRRNKMEDYPQYVKGCDIVSFDIYPVVHETPEITGKLEYVARGVERLVQWTGGKKPAWNCIECTDIHGVGRKATPAQVRSEVWMGLIRGSRGIIYFVHQFKPDFKEAALLNDPEMLAGVTAINKQIRELAPVLNSPTLTDELSVIPAVPVAAMHKRHGGTDYIFAVNLSPQPAEAAFTLKLAAVSKAIVLEEKRTIAISERTFSDKFAGYAVHLYRVEGVPAPSPLGPVRTASSPAGGKTARLRCRRRSSGAHGRGRARCRGSWCRSRSRVRCIQ